MDYLAHQYLDFSDMATKAFSSWVADAGAGLKLVVSAVAILSAIVLTDRFFFNTDAVAQSADTRSVKNESKNVEQDRVINEISTRLTRLEETTKHTDKKVDDIGEEVDVIGKQVIGLKEAVIIGNQHISKQQQDIINRMEQAWGRNEWPVFYWSGWWP